MFTKRHVIAALFIVIPNWKTAKCLSPVEQINCVYSHHVILLSIAMWMNAENGWLTNKILSKRSQIQKEYIQFHLNKVETQANESMFSKIGSHH